MRQVPFHRPAIGPAEEREVIDTLRSGWITTGPKTKKFEQEFAAYVGARNALAVAHCTGALHLALFALGIGPVGGSNFFRFYADKNITSAEGGMITTEDDALAAKIAVASLHGMDRDAWK